MEIEQSYINQNACRGQSRTHHIFLNTLNQ